MIENGASVQVFGIKDPGHTYELLNWMAAGSQELKFIKKQPQEGADSKQLELVQEGTTTEAVALVLIDRLKHLDAKLPSDFNKEAIKHLEMALNYLGDRTQDRVNRGVEGTNNE